jgi:hypothetical protein
MVIVHRLNLVLGNLIHIEEANAHALARHAAHLFDGCLQSLRREMFEQVVDDAEIKGFVRRGDVKDVGHRERDAGEKGACVINVLAADVETSVARERCDAIGVEEAVVVGGAAGGLYEGEGLRVEG